MKIEFVALLKIQRELYDVPGGWERFNRYIQTMTGGSQDMVLPLGAMNPMGKPHVAAYLDDLIALGVEVVAVQAVADAESRLVQFDGSMRIGLVVVDDVGGGWTHRYLSEFDYWFKLQGEVKRGWATVLCWVSETPCGEQVREAVLAAIFRFVYNRYVGWPETLGDIVRREGLALRFGGVRSLGVEGEDLTRAKKIIDQHREAMDMPTVFACLYGDEIAASVGYQALGLPERAGFAVGFDACLNAIPEDELVVSL